MIINIPDEFKRHIFTCWISSWSCVILSICDNSCSIARFSLRRHFGPKVGVWNCCLHVLGQHRAQLVCFFIFIMGNDGGSIPDRRDLVRNKPKVCGISEDTEQYLNDSLY